MSSWDMSHYEGFTVGALNKLLDEKTDSPYRVGKRSNSFCLLAEKRHPNSITMTDIMFSVRQINEMVLFVDGYVRGWQGAIEQDTEEKEG